MLIKPNSKLILPRGGKGLLSVFNRTSQEDPLTTFAFAVEIDGFARFGFSKASGLKSDTAVMEYREGGDNTTSRKSPGLTTFPNVMLERGQILASGLGDKDTLLWYQQVFDQASKKAASSNTFRRQLDIVQYTKEGNEAARWRLKQAWPKGHTPCSDLDALQANNSIEVMEIVHEGYLLVPVTATTP